MTALLCAIVIHILIIELSDSQNWFEIDTQPSTFELFLLPAAQTTSSDESTKAETFSQNEDSQSVDKQSVDQPPVDTIQAIEEEKQPAKAEQAVTEEEKIKSITPTEPAANMVSDSPTGKELSERNNEFDPQEVINNIDNEESLSENLFQAGTQNSSIKPAQSIGEKPELLDLSKISLSPDVEDKALTDVFSEELRDKISESKKAQKDYLKGLTKEIDYPITKDADGTRYVNIKGVCWRLPKEGSNEGWAIVFDGCGMKSKLFHFELNISPSIITNEVLGPDSPFNLDQPTK